MIVFKLAIRELWGSRKQLSLPSFTLSLAVASLFVLLSFQFKIDQLILMEGRGSLGGDIEVEAIRPISVQEKMTIAEVLPPETEMTSVIDFNTMMQLPDLAESRFVRLYVIDFGFPFYGEWEIQGAQSFNDLHQEAFVFVPKDVADQYSLKIGSKVRLGEKDFRLGGIVTKRPGQFTASLGFAPTIWVSKKFLGETELLNRPGRVDYMQLYKIPSNANPKELSEEIREALPDPILRIESFEDAQRGFQRVFSQLKLFGQIISLAALVIASFSIFGSLQTWFKQRRFLIAVLRSFGASRNQINQMVVASALILSTSASFVGLILGYLAQWSLDPVVNEFVKLPKDLELPVSVFIASFLAGIVSTLLFSLWTLLEVSSFKPALLIRTELEQKSRMKTEISLSSLLILSFYGFAIYLTQSIKFGSILTAAVLVSIGLSAYLSSWFFRFLSKSPLKSNLPLLYATRSILRERNSSLITAGLFFLVGLILSAMIIVEKGIQSELSVSSDVKQSSVFIFDLGEEKKEEVEEFLMQNPDVEATWASWVNTRWLKINGTPIEDHLEEVRSFDRERPAQISSGLPRNSVIVDGRMWNEEYREGLVEVSISDFYANERNIKVGDILDFSIFGVEFQARVTSLRRIRWIDFEPAFVSMFQSGFFEDLPLNYLASFATSSRESRLQFLTEFTKSFPEVSLIDVSEVKASLIEITEQVSVVSRSILLFLLFLGFSLVAALSREKLLNRKGEFACLKAIGASKQQLTQMIGLEFLLLSLLPSSLGSFIGFLAGNWGLDYFFNAYQLFWSPWVLLLPILTSFAVILIGLFGSLQLFSVKPRLLFADH